MVTTTAEVEEIGGACAKCNSSTDVYLDAASGLVDGIRCAVCEMTEAVSLPAGRHALDDEGSVVELFEDCFVAGDELKELLEEDWKLFDDKIDGKLVAQPRLIAYQARGKALSKAYSYEGLSPETALVPTPMTDSIARIRRIVETRVFGRDDQFFNSVHMNLYRDGRDHVSWHTDQDIEIYGPTPIIASVSFGSQRIFGMRNQTKQVKIRLEHGSILVMSGCTQEHWEHSIRKEASATEPRVNLTFRHVLLGE